MLSFQTTSIFHLAHSSPVIFLDAGSDPTMVQLQNTLTLSSDLVDNYEQAKHASLLQIFARMLLFHHLCLTNPDKAHQQLCSDFIKAQLTGGKV
jgi:hypothetical protein